MNQQLQQSINSWQEWITQFQFDPIYGYLINPQYQPKSFNYQTLHQILKNLHIINQSGQIIQIINNLPQIIIDNELKNYKDMVILHDLCSYLIHSYIKVLKDKQISQHQIKIPKNLAIPLTQSAGFLQIKTGMATGIGYNWYFNKKIENLDNMIIDDIEIKYYYSNHKQSQGLFFKVSVVTSYLLGRIIKNCYQINCIILQQPNLIEEVLVRMNKIKFYLKRIFDTNLQIQLKMDKQFFFYVLRVYVAGYLNVYFQGIDQRISSSGGAGGYDPSFQAFQRAFGLYFQDQIGNVQQKLRHGMPEQNRALVDFFAQHSIIRDYCQCTRQLEDAYNQVLQGYAKYLQLHGTFIKNFILNMIPQFGPNQNKKAPHGQGIQRIMQKFRFVRDQEITQQNKNKENTQIEQQK